MRQGEDEGLEVCRANNALPDRGSSTRRPWSPTSIRPRCSRARRFSARCWSPRRSARRMRRSRSPTTPATAWPRRSGRRTSIARSRSRLASRLASSGSIRPTCSTPPRASAAIAKAASAARAGAKACPSTGSPTRPSPSPTRPVRRASTPRPALLRRATRRRCARPHRQALYRRQAGAARFRLQLRRSRSRRPRGRTGRARQPQGHPQRGRSRGEGFVLGRGDGAQSRAGALLRGRESRRP